MIDIENYNNQCEIYTYNVKNITKVFHIIIDITNIIVNECQ